MKVLLLLTIFMLQACGMVRSFTAEEPPPEATLADLQPVSIPTQKTPLSHKSLDELLALYRAVLPLTDDPQIRGAVHRRLADIQMLRDEEQLAENGVSPELFDGAIAAYKQLLKEDPDSEVSDQYLYQLSKAYELRGDNKKSLAILAQLSSTYPDSWYFPEAEFRQAESYFVAGNYTRAEAGYSKVVDFGENSIYYTKALYMQGWSKFKLNQYPAAVASFTGSLDSLIPESGVLDSLPRSDREQVEDSFRILAVIFSYLGGAESITAAYQQLGEREYQYLLYQNLGDLYLSQERYRDSAETYKAYILADPDDPVSHEFQIKVIGAYEKGGFPELVVEEKQFYVKAFEQGSGSWLRSNWATRNAIDENLQQFIPELAQHYHALAQQSLKKDAQKEQAKQYYQLAASYYELYVETFPKSPEVAEMGFLLAESQFEAGDFAAAIESYEWVAYRFPQFDKSADAAYSAIISYTKLAASSSESQWESSQIDSELRFARVFFEDQRATAVLGHAARGLFDQGEYRQAAKTATKLVQWEPAPSVAITLPAWLLIGHSYFELENYADAEQAYQSALAGMVKDDTRHADTVERLAASIYKQGETAAQRRQYARAAQEFSRVLEVAPTSGIRINAQFDAAQNYALAGDLDEAGRLLNDFRKRYPKSPLSASIPAIMVGNYEKSGQWGAAASELDAIYASEPDAEKKREVLYQAAEYYQKAGDTQNAILRYRSYAHAYEKPFTIRMEAMNHLSQLYNDAGETQKQRFWLDKIIKSHDAGGAAQTDRSLYLAASASSVLAGDSYRAFRKLKLRIPLKTSLKKKKRAMDKAVKAYNKTNQYGVEQFSTLATFRLARIYQTLGSDLMNSERPGGLDPLALEQYDILLEEQAFPFEEKAIAIYQTNAKRSWGGVYDKWVRASFEALAQLMPARYAKVEHKAELSEDIY